MSRHPSRMDCRQRSITLTFASSSPVADPGSGARNGGPGTPLRVRSRSEDAGDASTVDTLSTRSGARTVPVLRRAFFAARVFVALRLHLGERPSAVASRVPAPRLVTVSSAHARVLLTTHRRARNRRRSALTRFASAFRLGKPSSRKRSSSSSSSSPSDSSSGRPVHDELQHGHQEPQRGDYRRDRPPRLPPVSGVANALCGALCVCPSASFGGLLGASAPGPPPPYRSRRPPPPRRARWPILSPTGLSPRAHHRARAARQFLLFSIPQWRLERVVVITFPSPIPLRDDQFSRAESHMHRNAARRVRNTPATPTQRTGTAAAGTPRGNLGHACEAHPLFGSGRRAPPRPPRTSPPPRNRIPRREADPPLCPPPRGDARLLLRLASRDGRAAALSFAFVNRAKTHYSSSSSSRLLAVYKRRILLAVDHRAERARLRLPGRARRATAGARHRPPTACCDAQLRCSNGAAALNAHTQRLRGPALAFATARDTLRHLPHDSDSRRSPRAGRRSGAGGRRARTAVSPP